MPLNHVVVLTEWSHPNSAPKSWNQRENSQFETHRTVTILAAGKGRRSDVALAPTTSMTPRWKRECLRVSLIPPIVP